MTNFENFKARLQQWMKNDPILNEKSSVKMKGKEPISPVYRENFYLSWKKNMDAAWSDFFWNNADGILSDDESDPAKKYVDGPFWVLLNRLCLLTHFIIKPESLEILRKKGNHEDDPEWCKAKACFYTMRMEKDDSYVTPAYHKQIFCENKFENCEHVFSVYILIHKVLSILTQTNRVNLLKAIAPSWQNKEQKISDFFWITSSAEKTFSNEDMLRLFSFAAYCYYFAAEANKTNEENKSDSLLSYEIDTNALKHWMQFGYQVVKEVENISTFANALTMILICLKAMYGANQADVYKFLKDKYADSLNQHPEKSLAEILFKGGEGISIYKSLGLDDSKTKYQEWSIWNEAFKSYLRVTSPNGWGELWDKIEQDNMVRGELYGFISKLDSEKNGSETDLLIKVNKRWEKLGELRESFKIKNDDIFITLLKAVICCNNAGENNIGNLSLSFCIDNEETWNSYIVGKVGRHSFSEEMCLLLDKAVDDIDSEYRNLSKQKKDKVFESIRMLIDNPEILEWNGQGQKNMDDVHSIQKYNKDGNLYLFNKTYINAGAIVLVPLVHDFLNYVISEKKDSVQEITKYEQKKTFFCSKTPDCVLYIGDCNSAKFAVKTTGIFESNEEGKSISCWNGRNIDLEGVKKEFKEWLDKQTQEN